MKNAPTNFFYNVTVILGLPPPHMDLDQLYLCLRPYGRLASLKPHASTEIAGERYAIARYEKWHGAISAKNCAHGAVIKGANGMPIQLALAYQKPVLQQSTLGTLARRFPALFIPVLLSGVMVLVYSAFDPLRVFAIKNTITRRFDVDFVKHALLTFPPPFCAMGKKIDFVYVTATMPGHA